MDAIDFGVFATSDMTPFIPTGADNRTSAIELPVPKQGSPEDQWNGIVDQLIEWGQAPELIDEDGLQSPSRTALRNALKLLRTLRQIDSKLSQGTDLFPPTRVVGNGEGGIVIEVQNESDFLAFEIGDDDLIELRAFKDCRLTARIRIPFE